MLPSFDDSEGEEGFSLVTPFYIDSGELDGLSLQQAFVLGYEFATLLEKLWAKDFPVELQIHSENESRIKMALDNLNAEYEVLAHDDWPIFILKGFSK